jgi:hypothetical protein
MKQPTMTKTAFGLYVSSVYPGYAAGRGILDRNYVAYPSIMKPHE